MHIVRNTLTKYGFSAEFWDIVTTTRFKKKINEQVITWDVHFILGLWTTLERLENRDEPIHTIPDVQLVFEQDMAPTRDQFFYKLMESNIKTTVNPTPDPETGANPVYTEELNIYPIGDFATVSFQAPDAVLVI